MMRTPILHPKKQIESFHKRLLGIGLLIILCWFGLMLRLYTLQLSHHTHYQTMSTSNRLRIELLKPKRGYIFDRHHVLLADNLPNFTVTILTHQSKSALSKTLKTLQIILKRPNQTCQSWLHKVHHHHGRLPLILATHLTPSEQAEIYVNLFRLPGVNITKTQQRHYPFDAITSTPLGIIQHQVRTKRLYPFSRKQHIQQSKQGLSGIEYQYDQILSGQFGHREIEVDAQGHWLRTTQQQAAIPGENLILTLDIKLQKALFHAFKNMSGAGVALDPNNGEILAMVSMPTYEPNAYTSQHLAKSLKRWRQNPERPLFNRVAFGLFPPASTVKPVLALMALAKNIIKPSDSIYDPGVYQLPGTHHLYRDWLAQGHGWVNLNKAIAESCDTYFYQLAIKLGIQNIDQILSDFGFGKNVTTDINSAFGVLNSPAWKHVHKHTPWYTGDTIISGIGQGNMLVTPLQLAHMTALIAGRGHGFKPHLTKAVVSPAGQIQPIPLEPWQVMPIKPSHYATIIRGMQAVMHSQYRHHTGKRFGQTHYAVAGKTGTAELYHRKTRQHGAVPRKLRDHSWFIGFAPVEKPKIAVAILVEHSPQAIVIARKIMDNFFANHDWKH